MSDIQHAWTAAFVSLEEGRGATCPHCHAASVECCYVADVQSRVGFAILICMSCRRAGHMSRVTVPPGRPHRDIADPHALVDLGQYVLDR